MFKDKRTAMVGTLVVALFLSLLTLMNPGKALAVSAFLKVDGVPGESTDDKHKDWIEVISWSFGETQPAVATGSAGGAASQRVKMQDFKVNMRTNKASPKLFGACAKGEHIKEVQLDVCKSGGDKSKFLNFKLTESMVSSFFVGLGSSGTGSADVYPMEEITFNFGKIEITYTQMDPQTGKLKGDIKSGWDLVKNSEIK